RMRGSDDRGARRRRGKDRARVSGRHIRPAEANVPRRAAALAWHADSGCAPSKARAPPQKSLEHVRISYSFRRTGGHHNRWQRSCVNPDIWVTARSHAWFETRSITEFAEVQGPPYANGGARLQPVLCLRLRLFRGRSRARQRHDAAVPPAGAVRANARK